ncbi:MAG: glycosyltransferase family 2 protein, partial [Pseudomonadota bacterium]
MSVHDNTQGPGDRGGTGDLDLQPAVSVVIPCRDAAGTVVDALASAQTQEGCRVEIICIDDGSGDMTSDLLKQECAKGAFRLLRLTPSRGAPAARNAGLNEATGRAVQFLDADDVLLPGKLARQLALLDRTGADFVAGSYERQDMQGDVTMHSPEPDIWAGLIASRLGRTSSNLYRTDALRRIGGWTEDQKSSQEYELMFRLLKAGAEVVPDPVPGARLRVSRNSISSTNLAENAKRFLQLR